VKNSRFKNSVSKVDRLSAVVTQIRNAPVDQPLNALVLARLLFAWGNIGYSASVRYLQQIERLFRATGGGVLECGSGASTLLLALLAEKYDRHVWTFENHADWSRHVRDVMKGLQLSRVTVCHTPLCNYGKYDWYQLPQHPLPRDFGLVVCDGPPGTIQGGRYGLLPVMSGYMREDCRILLDDTNRRKERALIHRWAEEQRMVWNRLGTTGRCAEISFT